MLKKYDTEQFIKSKFLDLMETTPFYKIKVKDFAEYAGIGRSTFYMYFDSIYAVVERLEDDFINTVFPEGHIDRAAAVLRSRDSSSSQAFSQDFIKRIKPHLREFRILVGPNGSHRFAHQLSKITRKIYLQVTEVEEPKISGYNPPSILSAAFIGGGAMYVLKAWAGFETDFSEEDMEIGAKLSRKCWEMLLNGELDS